MALTRKQKRLVAKLGQYNSDPDYVFNLIDDEAFALSEIASNALKIKQDLLKEKSDIEAHIVELNRRVNKIQVLLTALEG